MKKSQHKTILELKISSIKTGVRSTKKLRMVLKMHCIYTMAMIRV